MMIGESTCLGRGGIHYDLFIKVDKIERDPITRLWGPISPAISKWSASITHGWHYHSSPFNGGVSPRAPPSFIFFYFKHV